MAKAAAGKPFDGAISRFFEKDLPKNIRKAIETAGKKDILDPAYPYRQLMGREEFEKELESLQLELVRLQASVRSRGERLLLVFEGRDAAGKGGTIERFRLNLNPRYARVVALPKPSDTEATQWYFQRYIAHLPSAGEIVFFDRSWYNRAVVEQVFGWCSPAQRATFFAQVGEFEDMLVRDGIRLHKFWLTVGRAEQMRRFLDREGDPLKHWKLSQIDVDGLPKWEDYTSAIAETMAKTHSKAAPWTVIWAEDQRRARLAAIRSVLAAQTYAGKGRPGAPDPAITGGPALLAGRAG
jgi:polyphosphate kinase 2